MWQANLLPSLFPEESFGGVLPTCTDVSTVSGCEHDSYLTHRPKSLLKIQLHFCLTGRKKGIKTGWGTFISAWSLYLNGVTEQLCSSVKLHHLHCLARRGCSTLDFWYSFLFSITQSNNNSKRTEYSEYSAVNHDLWPRFCFSIKITKNEMITGTIEFSRIKHSFHRNNLIWNHAVTSRWKTSTFIFNQDLVDLEFQL